MQREIGLRARNGFRDLDGIFESARARASTRLSDLEKNLKGPADRRLHRCILQSRHGLVRIDETVEIEVRVDAQLIEHEVNVASSDQLIREENPGHAVASIDMQLTDRRCGDAPCAVTQL
jgi:hypothetical protein